MPNIGPMEIAIVLVIALIIFGPSKLPELGKSAGRGFREFKNSVTGGGDDDDAPAAVAPVARVENSEPAEPAKV